jgi:DNA primase
MPTDEDPDQFVRTHGSARFRELLRTTQPYMEFIVEESLARHDTSRPSGKVEAINSILPHLIRMRDRVERAEYADQIANRLKVDSRIIREEIKRAASARQPNLDSKRMLAAEAITQAERQLLELILARPDVRSAILSSIAAEDVAELASSGLFSAILQLERDGGIPDYNRLCDLLETDQERAMAATLLMSDLAWVGGDDFDTFFKRATEAITSLRVRNLERKLDAIQIELGKAEREKDTDLVLRLWQEKAEVKKRMLRLTA